MIPIERVIVSDARFFNFKSTSSDERRECADFWQSWFNQTFTSADYNSFFYREPDSAGAGGGKGVTPVVTAKQTRSTVYVDQSAATPVYVQTSPVDGKNILVNWQQKSKRYLIQQGGKEQKGLVDLVGVYL